MTLKRQQCPRYWNVAATGYRMENKRLTLPERKNYEVANECAYQLACQKLAEITDIKQQCRNSGTRYQEVDSTKKIFIQYLDLSYQITFPEVTISVEGSTEDVPVKDRLLILHYFLSAKGTPLANKLVTFRELPEGKVYSPTFDKRTSQPLLDCFGRNPQLLLGAARVLGGKEADYGDTAVTINAFSRVPITIVLWRGDDEFSAQSSVLFDTTISDYLPTEDITILCEVITWRLIRSVKKV